MYRRANKLQLMIAIRMQYSCHRSWVVMSPRIPHAYPHQDRARAASAASGQTPSPLSAAAASWRAQA
eukprot:1175978-Prymnesium_polylepis.1